MIEFLCENKKGKPYRCLVDVRDIVEVVEDEKGKAVIRVMRSVKRKRCWILTVESFEQVQAKLEAAKDKRTSRF